MPDSWDGHSNYNTQRAIAEMRASTSLREAINNMIEQTSNDLEAQRLRTEYAFRKRIHEVLRFIFVSSVPLSNHDYVVKTGSICDKSALYSAVSKISKILFPPFLYC